MNLVSANAKIITPYSSTEWERELLKVEQAYRICYKSEGQATEKSYETFIPRKIHDGHLSPLEHMNISVELTCSRGIQQEITRHRLAAYSIESTRWINYLRKNDGDIRFIKPDRWDSWSIQVKEEFFVAYQDAENHYNTLVALGVKPEYARDVLPLGLASDIIMTANAREWRHIFGQRVFDNHAHPDIRDLFTRLLLVLGTAAKPIFGDLKDKLGE